MNEAKFQQINGGVLAAYPVLREAGITKPTKNGRVILTRTEFTNLFQDRPSKELAVDLSRYLGSMLLAKSLDDVGLKEEDRAAVVNQHINLAEAYLLHHSKRLPSLYKDNIEDFQRVRGAYLKQLALLDDAGVVSWTAYAHWANAQANVLAETDPKQSENLRQDAEDVLRMAHEANYPAATEALGTLLYVTKSECDEPIALWEKAALVGNPIAIHNLFNIVMDDDSFYPEERSKLLASVWEGVAKNKKETADVAKALKKLGYSYVSSMDKVLVPA